MKMMIVMMMMITTILKMIKIMECKIMFKNMEEALKLGKMSLVVLLKILTHIGIIFSLPEGVFLNLEFTPDSKKSKRILT